MQTFNDSNFDARVLNSSKPVLVKFGAAWCGPCKIMAPEIAKLAKGLRGIDIGEIDIDEAPLAKQRCAVKTVPTVILFQGGKALFKLAGVRSVSEIGKEINRVLGGGDG